MRVLGIDPGTIRMGVAVVDSEGSRTQCVTYESVQVSKNLTLPDRLKEIHDSVRGFIERYTPDLLALENVFFDKDVRALVKIGEARASVMLAAAEKKVPVVEYPPARVKQAISGNGRASKVQVQQMVKHLFHLKTAPPSDAADALAVALCHLQCQRGLRFLGRVSGREKNVRIPVG